MFCTAVLKVGKRKRYGEEEEEGERLIVDVVGPL